MSGDYISREALKQALTDKFKSRIGASRIPTWNDAFDAVTNLPAADVVGVRHGRWINICGYIESPRQCSECLQDFSYIDGICYLVSGQRLPQYCPACGAKMDGGQDEAPTGPYDLLYEEGGPNTT